MQGFKKIVKKALPAPVERRLVTTYRGLRFRIQCRNTAVFAARIDRRTRKMPCIVFLIGMPEVWNSLKSLYEAAIARSDIRAYVVALPKLRCSVAGDRAFDNPAYDFLKRSGVANLIRAYNPEAREWFDLRCLQPDYAVYTRTYLHEYSPEFSPKNVRRYAKVCLIPYAYNMLENRVAGVVFNERFIGNCSMVFLASQSRLDKCVRAFEKPYKKGTLKLFYKGFPRYDILREQRERLAARPEQSEGLRVLWLPRWTTESDFDGCETSHFRQYAARFLRFFAEHPSMQLMIRPHPKMFDNFVKKGTMAPEDVLAFYERCNRISNVRIHDDRDYLEAFAWSDLLIADYTSLLMEYYITGKPIIQCQRSDNLSAEGERLQKTIDIASSWDEIEALLLRYGQGDAPRQADRSDVLKMVLPPSEAHIGRSILACILKN